jgi:ATP-dependent exoDNAse (exonuclease V) beta subunit
VLHFRALLDVISNPLDETALAAVLACGIGRVSDDGLWSLRQDATANKDSIWHALKREAEGALSARDRETVGRIVRAVDAARARVGREPLQDILLRAVEDAEFDLELLADPEEGMPALANVARVAEMAREFEESGGTGPAGFALYLADRERFNEHTAPATIAREGSRMVRITSVHSSKGLEYPVVAVVEAGAPRHVSQDIARWSCREGALTLAAKNPFTAGSAAQSPDFSRLDTAEKQAEDDESKRLFYVACTRARDVLIVSGTTDLDKADEGLALTQIDRVSAALRGSVVLPSRGTGPVSVFLGEHQVRLEAAEPLARTEASEAGEAPSSTQKDRVSSSGQESVSTDHEEGGLCRDSGQVGAAGRPSLPERLSYTDLALFDACELRFYLERVLRIGRISSAPAGAASFGSAVHTALQLSAAGHPPAAERLTALARRFQLNDALHGEMTAAVATFVRSELAHALEGHATVRREWAFALRLGPQDSPVDLVGTMDAYGRSGITGLVVDYKSGASGDASELEERYRLQARCYALVALADGCDVVDVVFCRPQVRDAGDRMQEVRFRFSRQDAGEIEQEILERRRRMGSSTRQPRETWSAHACVACSASGTLCSRVEPGSRSDA